MSDLWYLNTRLRAMRARLLSRSDYDRLLALEDVPGVAAALRDTPYGRRIDAAGTAGTDVARIEEAFRRELSDTLSRLLALSPGDCAEAVRLLLGGWELQVVKTVLRGTAAGAPPGDILSALVPTGLHDEAALGEMCRQRDPRALAELLLTWGDPWGRALTAALRGYREPRDLFLAELSLDASWSAQAAGRLGGIPRPDRGDPDRDALSLFVALSVDRTNLVTALKCVAERLALQDPERCFLPGGRVYDRAAFDRVLASRGVAEGLAVAAKSFFRGVLRALAPSPEAQAPPLPEIERRLELVRLRAARSQARADPHGYGPLVGYLLDKLREVGNLRMIVRARLSDLPEADLRRFLILEY